MLNVYEYRKNTKKLIYITYSIESVNSCLRKVTNGKGSFVNIEALEKVLYLRVKELSKKWNRNAYRNWGMILNELLVYFGDRVEKYIEL